MGDDTHSFTRAVDQVQKGERVADVANDLLSQLSFDERQKLLYGIPFWGGVEYILEYGFNATPWIIGDVPRVGIPGVRFTDGPRGVIIGKSTAFPVSMARGATWDVALEERVGVAIGREARAQAANFFGGVCINLPRHPAWGRSQETYGEDPILLGEMGAALARGAQSNVMTCVKHFALNSMENARFKVDVKVDDAALHEVYLPHFKRVVDEGVTSVMSAYNAVNGEWAGQSRPLLTNILRHQWGFSGFVISDFAFGHRDGALSLKNGMTLEAPFAQLRPRAFRKALAIGALSKSDIDSAAHCMLTSQLKHYATRELQEPQPGVVFCQDHRRLAREAAQKSMVLLKNEIGSKPLLPLDPKSLTSIAVVGRLANAENTGDHGSSIVSSPKVVTPYEGIRAALSETTAVTLASSDDVSEATRVASVADAAVVVVGYDAGDEGEYLLPTAAGLWSLYPFPTFREVLSLIWTGLKLGYRKVTARHSAVTAPITGGVGGDRASLRLRASDLKLINSVCAVNPRTIVAIITAGAVIMEEWRHQPSAILQAWYSGCEGGHALADVLFGDVDASGRLPYSIPKSEDHLPYFEREATSITYDRWFGQRLLDKLGVEAAFPLGFGLSYTSFDISDLSISPSKKDTIEISVTVTNTGFRPGRFVAQAYGSPLPAVADFPTSLLLGFAPVELKGGESRRISIQASLLPLQQYKAGQFTFGSSKAAIQVGRYAGDKGSLVSSIDLN
jgi:beta-glucosidase